MSNLLLDIHTHHEDGKPGEAIISKMPRELAIEPGKWYSVGIHPWYLNGLEKEDLDLLCKLAEHPQVLAIGEAGFDNKENYDRDAQLPFFVTQSALSSYVEKPLIIHMVGAADKVLWANKLRKHEPWIIHGFRGKEKLANQLLDAGLYLSFGARYNVDALRATPLDRLFLETDEATCGIQAIYNKVAADLKMDVDELKKQVKKNIDRIFFKK